MHILLLSNVAQEKLQMKAKPVVAPIEETDEKGRKIPIPVEDRLPMLKGAPQEA